MKISKFVNIGTINLHIKRGKSHYTGNLSINIDGEILHIREESHDMKTLIDALTKNMRKITKKMKSRVVKGKKKDVYDIDYLF